jgi:hypothetical protein
VNALIHQAIRRFQVIDEIAGHKVNLTLSLHRWKLSLLERALVEQLRERSMVPAPRQMGVAEIRPKKEGRVWLAGRLQRTRHLALTVYKKGRLAILRRLKGPSSLGGVRRLLFLDANEIRVSRIGGKRYVYHKYLEGLIDLDTPRIDDDLRVVLYGDARDVPRSVLHHPRVIILALESDPASLARALARASLLAQTCVSSYFHGVAMPRSLRQQIEKSARFLEDVMRDDVAIIDATERLLAKAERGLEITLDTHDSILFSLAQHLLARGGHTVIGVQRVLGPYTFSYNFRRSGELFRPVHKIFCWGSFHARQITALGHRGQSEIVGMRRMALYRSFLAEGRSRPVERVRAALGAPPGLPVVMFSVVREVVGFPLVDPLRWVDLVISLAALARDRRCFVVFKPWPGEDTTVLKRLVAACFPPRSARIVDVRLGARLHNMELLSATDVLISTLSSFIGEAVSLGAVPVLVTGKSARAYFTRAWSGRFRRFCPTLSPRKTLAEVVEPLLDPAARARYLAALDPAFGEVFGPLAERED